MKTFVPMPVDDGFCLACKRDVPIDDRGRCACGELCIYASDRPRPNIVTPTLAMLQEAGRLDRMSRQGVHRQPKNVRRLPGGRR